MKNFKVKSSTKREYAIKQMIREDKEKLIKG